MTTIGGRNFPHSSQSGTAVHESFPIVSLTCCGVGDGPRSRSRTVIVLWCMFAVLAYRSEEHTSELQSLMRISYAGFCLQTKIDPYLDHDNFTLLRLDAVLAQ